MWGVPQIRGTFLGVPRIRITIFETTLGFPYFGKVPCTYPPHVLKLRLLDYYPHFQICAWTLWEGISRIVGPCLDKAWEWLEKMSAAFNSDDVLALSAIPITSAQEP